MTAQEWPQHIPHCKSMGIFQTLKDSLNAVCCRISTKFELIQDFMVMLVKKNENPLKNEGARVFTTSYINFSDAQGQIIPESVVVSD